MKKTIKEMFQASALTGKAAILAAAVAASAAFPSLGDDSAFARGTSAAGRLDLRTGTRIATEGAAERITYSPRWGNAASCTIDLGGSRSVATSEGETTWPPSGTGAHTLTHTAGDLTYTAQFTVLGDDVVLHGGILAAGETWGTDKVHLVTAAVTVPSGISLTIEAGAVVKFMPGTSLTVASGGSCTARGVIFTHVNDDTIGGDVLFDGASAVAIPMGDYAITGNITDDDSTEYRYMPPQTLQSSISSNTRLRGYRTYIVSNSVTVASGATLTLQPGTILKFNTGCSLTVNGTLDAQGTRAAPIVFTSLKDDAHGGDANGDGDKTYAQAGDWARIYAGGTLNMKHCLIRHCNNNSDQGAIQGTGGTVTFDNSIIESSVYECVRMNSGRFTAHNSVFRDSSMGFGYYGGSGVYIYNCVVADCTIGCRASNKHFYNTVFYRCQTFLESTSSSCDHCVFFNPSGYGAQTVTQVGSNGNVWGDPLFVDAANGDFHIAANSPCVDAGDGSVAPETDYWGQPRMDVKAVADTGTPSGDGVCPDIGIYEVPGAAAVPLPDLAVVKVATSTTLPVSVGDMITVNYTVTNRGAAAVTGFVRDLFRFKGADAATASLTIDAAEIEQAYNIAAGGCATFTTTFTVPSLKAGAWKIGVVANAERDVYENVVANNSAETEDAIMVSVDSFAVGGSKVVDIPSGGVAGAAVTGLPASGGAIVAALPNGVKFYASVGYVPDDTRHDVAGTALADGRVALFIPAHEAGETVYVMLVNDSGTAQTVTLDALASSDGLEVAKPADVAVTAKGPKVTAKLVLPESIRDGRIYAAWVEYSNSGDEDAELPIFTISRTGGGATLSATAKGTYSANPLSLIGLAPSAPRGKLKPGEAGRVAFYFMSAGTLSLKLGMVTEKSNSMLNGFSSVAEYRTGMSAAATRLCARGGAEPGFTEVLAQALNEKRGAGGAAVCGTLRHSVTKLPLAGVEMHLVATNDDSVASAVLTDANGHFVLTADEAGDFAVDVRGVSTYTPCIKTMCIGTDDQVSVYAMPLSSVSGFAERPDSLVVAAGATVVLDDLATSAPEDFVAEADETGRYSFNGVADGEYRLSLYPLDGYAIVETEAFSVSNGVSFTRNLAYGAKGRVVSGVVSDVETGEAVTNAVVMLARKGMQIGVTTDEQGRYAFDGIEPGRWGVSLQAAAHQSDGVSELIVEAGEGTQTANIPARAKCPFAVLRPVGMAPHTATFAMVREDATSLEWDFDGDGVMDSTAAAPEWVYANAGTYTVALSYTDGGGVRRRSQWTNAVKVLAAFDNVLKANGVLVSESAGVTVESVSETELVLSGAGVSAWTNSGTVLGAESSSRGGFIKRVISAENLGGNRWKFTVENAGLGDLFERYFMSGDIAFTAAKARKMMAGAKLLGGSGHSGEEVAHGSKVEIPDRSPDEFHQLPTLTYTPLFSDASASITGSFSAWNGDVIKGSYGALVYDGKVLEFWYSSTDTYQATVTASVSYTKDWTKGLTGKEFHKGWNQSWADFPIGWGFSLSLQTDEDVKFTIEGSGTLTCEQSFKARRTQTYYFDEDGELDFSQTIDWGATVSTKRSLTGSVSPTIDASLTLGLYGSFAKFIGRAGGGPKVGAKISLSQNVEVGGVTSVSVGSSGGDLDVEPVAESKLELGFTPYVGVNVSWKWLNIPKAKKYDVDLPLKIEWPNTASAGKMGIDVSGDGLTVTLKARKPKIEASGYIFKNLLHLDEIEIPTHKYLWGLGDGSLLQEGETLTHTYAKPGKYKIRLFGESLIPATLITYTGSPFIRTSVKWIEVFDDKSPEPQNTEDSTTKNPKQSCDPNEMDGPDGVGEERYVKPGDWMTYTVYFENKADADVPAQEVRVTNPLSQWLDWSTFEMRDIAFCNQVETGLAGKQNGTITVDQNDTAYKVQATVALDDKNGAVEWYLRSVDPARAEYNYWPLDGEGLLPPNDETHRGEGHITYRIKVRDDAPANVVITNSASIVFDLNDPIETDPAWWNTVGASSTGVEFVDSEIVVNEGENAVVRITGSGTATGLGSVSVYLTYNTATSADLNLGGILGTDTTGRLFGGKKFPVAFDWGVGESGENVLVIPIKADKTVEGDEFFTLQLANPQRQELGVRTICTVRIADAQERVAPAGATVTTNATGEVTGYFTKKDKKGNVTAKAMPGYVFTGWVYTKNGKSYSTKATITDKLRKSKKVQPKFAVAHYLRALADPANGGKVTGSGLYAEKKSVTLKATPNKYWTFEGWYRKNEEVIVNSEQVGGIGEFVTKSTTVKMTVTNDATYVAMFKPYPKVTVAVDNKSGGTVKGAGSYLAGKTATLTATPKKGYAFCGWFDADGNLVTLNASYKYKVTADGLALQASFKKESALAKPELTWGGETNLTVGVSYSAKLTVRGESVVSITKVTGLPKGLTFKSGKVSGVPTVAKAVTTKVTVALKSNAKKTWTYSVKLNVAALPTWAVGTFKGTLYDGDGEGAASKGTVTLTAGKTGKISGKFVDTKKKAYAFTAASFKTYDEDGVLRAKATMKYGKKTVTVEIAVGQDGETSVGFAEVGSTAAPFSGQTAVLAK